MTTPRHQPSAQSNNLVGFTVVVGETAPKSFADNQVFTSEAVAITIAYKIGLWFSLFNVGAASGGAKLSIFLICSPVEEGDIWFELGDPTDPTPGFIIAGNHVSEEGVSFILPFENPGGIKRVRVLVIPTGMSESQYITGEVGIGSLR